MPESRVVELSQLDLQIYSVEFCFHNNLRLTTTQCKRQAQTRFTDKEMDNRGEITCLSLNIKLRASWGYGLGRLRGHVTYAVTQSPTLGWMLYCYHLEILNSFWTRKINFHFALGPANYAASPVSGSRDLAQFGLCSHWRQLSECQRHFIACVYLHVGLHPQPGDYKRSGGVLSTQHRAWHSRDVQEMFIEQVDWKTNRLLIQL